jgi:glycosyltransferase 2 family protein
MLLTIALKAWRWQLMFATEPPVLSFSPAFWGVALGQYVNLLVPFVRLGEIARLYGLNQETGIHPARAIGTLVLEKTLDLIFFGLTIIFILPFVIVPDYVNKPGGLYFLLPGLLLIVLYLLSFRTQMVITLWRFIVRPLPDRIENWFLRIAVTGLEGLAALREKRLSLLLLATSALIAILSVLLPFALFPSLGLSLSILDAALIHVVVSIAIAPPSTPAKIGVFNGAAALMLYQFGLEDETAIFSYAILLYLVVIIPQIILGLFAASRSKWRWRMVPNVPPVDSPT